MEKLKEHNDLLEMANNYTDTPIDKLIRNKNWGSLNFEDAKDDLEKAYSILNHFKVLPIELLDTATTQAIINRIKPVGDVIGNIINFTIEQPDAVAQRTSILNQLKANVNALYKEAHMWIPFLAYQKGDVQKNINALTRAVDEAKETVENSKKEISEKKDEINKIITAAREASASVGVAHFTADFLTEAKALETISEKWLRATVISAVLTIIAAILMLFLINGEIHGTFKIIQLSTTKIVVLAVFLGATLWCGKIYKANKHLAIINKHRANSLKTFQAFTKAADNDQARDAVLLETTRAIFGITATGYLDSDSQSSDVGTRIIELIKSGSNSVKN